MGKPIKKEKTDIVIDGKKYKKNVFMVEEEHPAIGRILIIEDMKFRILDDFIHGGHRSGTYIRKMTEEDEETMQEYDDALEELSEKLVTKVDIKRLIKENMKRKPLQDIKTGLFILKEQEKGKKVEEEHSKGCYNFSLHCNNQSFNFMSGDDVPEDMRGR